jgi:putative transposase
MDGSIVLSVEQRKTLLNLLRSGPDVRMSRRAHVILLLADGHSHRHIRTVAYVSFDFVADCARRFREGSIESLCTMSPQPPEPSWLEYLLKCLLEKTPEDFGYFRSRWSCDTLAEVLAWEKDVHVSTETVRRALHRANFVWRRPRPVLRRQDVEYKRKLRRIHDLLESLPPDETAVFEDEVDVHLNPKIGSCWMPCGEQAEVETPGNNDKRHLAGSLVWRTGTLLVSPAGPRRNADLFLAHLNDLRYRLRTYRVIHVICDNASFHDCRKLNDYLAMWGHRIRVHYLPKYAPETNPIERIWWRMHERITRNHRCKDIDSLLQKIFGWIETEHRYSAEVLSPYTIAA